MHVHTKEQVLRDLRTRREEGTEPLILRDGVFSELDFSKEDLRGLDCPHSNWFESKLVQSNCSEMDARESRFNYVDMTGANLQETKFGKADVDHSALAHAHCAGMTASHAQFYITNAAHATFSFATMDHCLFLGGGEEERTTLAHAHFEGTYLLGAILSGVDASNTDFRFAHLRGAAFNQVHLFGADLSYADCYGADLRGANLEGATLTYTILGNTLFDSVAQLRAANLYAIHEAFQTVMAQQPRERVEHYYQQLSCGEDPHLAAFFQLYPVEDNIATRIPSSLPQSQQAQIVVGRFANNQRDRKSHPVSQLLREWLTEWFEDK